MCVYDGGSAGMSTDQCSVYIYILTTVIIFFQSVLLEQSYSLRFFFFAFFKTVDVHEQDFQQFMTAVRTFFFLVGTRPWSEYCLQ